MSWDKRWLTSSTTVILTDYFPDAKRESFLLLSARKLMEGSLWQPNKKIKLEKEEHFSCDRIMSDYWMVNQAVPTKELVSGPVLEILNSFSPKLTAPNFLGWFHWPYKHGYGDSKAVNSILYFFSMWDYIPVVVEILLSPNASKHGEHSAKKNYLD